MYAANDDLSAVDLARRNLYEIITVDDERAKKAFRDCLAVDGVFAQFIYRALYDCQLEAHLIADLAPRPFAIQIPVGELYAWTRGQRLIHPKFRIEFFEIAVLPVLKKHIDALRR